MNRIDQIFSKKKEKVLSVYITAGFPFLDSTVEICKALSKAGVDLIEIGIPFSDPVADGTTIQKANELALKNGISLTKIFVQVEAIRREVQIPILLMGYINPVLQFGIENFCKRCRETGIDGTILPDLPFAEFNESYKELFEKNDLKNIFLVTPQSADLRIKEIDASSSGFLYAVSSSAITGGSLQFNEERLNYLKRLKNMALKNPIMVGFGIAKRDDFNQVSNYARGAIIGSAFIRAIEEGKENLTNATSNFISGILN